MTIRTLLLLMLGIRRVTLLKKDGEPVIYRVKPRLISNDVGHIDVTDGISSYKARLLPYGHVVGTPVYDRWEWTP